MKLTFTSNTQHTDSVIWHFGNGSYLSDSIVSYLYLQSGEFLPTLVFATTIMDVDNLLITMIQFKFMK